MSNASVSQHNWSNACVADAARKILHEYCGFELDICELLNELPENIGIADDGLCCSGQLAEVAAASDDFRHPCDMPQQIHRLNCFLDGYFQVIQDYARRYSTQFVAAHPGPLIISWEALHLREDEIRVDDQIHISVLFKRDTRLIHYDLLSTQEGGPESGEYEVTYGEGDCDVLQQHPYDRAVKEATRYKYCRTYYLRRV